MRWASWQKFKPRTALMTVNPLRLLIGFYRAVISPLKPPCCRYIPTCSEYARQAVTVHGPLAGSWLALRRILRCHPFSGYGLDEVPLKSPSRKDTP